jgi:protein-tyrosine phosphatase/arsenate reductase
MYPKIKDYILEVEQDFMLIPSERKALLHNLSQYIIAKALDNKAIQLMYVCTHNSRRSHFGQVWAKTAAAYYQIKHVSTYSGGTEATAFNENAINALKRVGFHIVQEDQTGNPKYRVIYDDAEEPCFCFSKVYDDVVNPKEAFAAIMTCSDAEENCPFIPGVELRIATTYEDPKAFDHTDLQDAKYDERCRQIALETLYVFSSVANQIHKI